MDEPRRNDCQRHSRDDHYPLHGFMDLRIPGNLGDVTSDLWTHIGYDLLYGRSRVVLVWHGWSRLHEWHDSTEWAHRANGRVRHCHVGISVLVSSVWNTRQRDCLSVDGSRLRGDHYGDEHR